MRHTSQDRSPVDKAGVKPGDLLVAIDGKPVTDAQVMLGLIAALAPGQEARFNLRRDGREVDLAITIGKRPTPRRE